MEAARLGGGAVELRGVGLSGQMHSAVFLDSDGEVIRPAPLWSDARTAPQCREITDKLGRTLWRVWCEHCGKHHYHGPGFGHREAHCQGVARDCRLGHNTHADTVRRHPEARHAPTLPLPGRGYGAPLKGGIMALEFSDGQM